jgi:hypothetical protein
MKIEFTDGKLRVTFKKKREEVRTDIRADEARTSHFSACAEDLIRGQANHRVSYSSVLGAVNVPVYYDRRFINRLKSAVDFQSAQATRLGVKLPPPSTHQEFFDYANFAANAIAAPLEDFTCDKPVNPKATSQP